MKKIIFRYSLCLFLLLTSNQVNAQLDIAAVALGGFTVEKILKDFESAASRLMAEGENHGNALMVSLGNQLGVLTQNAGLVMENQQNKLFNNLSATEKDFFIQLNSIISSSQGDLNRAVSILEVANLNLIELTNRLPLTKKTYAYINKVNGLTLTYQKINYRLSFSGLGFGQDDENIKHSFVIKLGAIAIPTAAISRIPPYEMSIQIDPKLLDPYFNDSRITFLPVTISTEINVKEKCGLVFNCKKTIKHTWNLKMILMPRNPGLLTGVELIKSQSLDGITKTKSVVVTTSGCKSDRPCDWSREIPLADNERVVGVRYACSGQCGWSYNQRHGGYAPDYDILAGGTKVMVYRHVDGEGATTVTYYADYQTMKDFVTERPITPIPLQFGNIAFLNLSPDNTSCTYRLQTKLVTGQEIYIDNSMTQSPDKLLIQVGTGRGPDGLSCKPSFKLNTP